MIRVTKVYEVHLNCVLFIDLFNTQILSPYYVLGTVLGFGKTAVNENLKVLASIQLIFFRKERK